jgi:predicted nucleic acid-binding protein
MIVLVDTSVWIDHLRGGKPRLADLLDGALVACHPLVIGELACGNLRNREEILALLSELPMALVADHAEALEFLHHHRLHGRGLGWVDVHLLASARLTESTLWTLDKSLHEAAVTLNLAVTP